MSRSISSPFGKLAQSSAMKDEMRTYRVLANVAKSDWAVHFIGPDGRTRIGPWLLFDSHKEVLEILRWGDISADEFENMRAACVDGTSLPQSCT